VMIVVLTGKGQELIEEALVPHVRAISEVMSVITGSDQDELKRLCRTLGVGQAMED